MISSHLRDFFCACGLQQAAYEAQKEARLAHRNRDMKINRRHHKARKMSEDEFAYLDQMEADEEIARGYLKGLLARVRTPAAAPHAYSQLHTHPSRA